MRPHTTKPEGMTESEPPRIPASERSRRRDNRPGMDERRSRRRNHKRRRHPHAAPRKNRRDGHHDLPGRLSQQRSPR